MRFSDEKRTRILELHAEGLTVREISEETGCLKASVRAFLRRVGINPNPARPQVNETELCRLWYDGKNVKEISEISGIGKDAIRKRLKDLGLYSKYDIYEITEDDPDCFNCPFPDCRWEQHGPCPTQKHGHD